MKTDRNRCELSLKSFCLVAPVAAVCVLGFFTLLTHTFGAIWCIVTMFRPPSKWKVFAPRLLIGFLIGLAMIPLFLRAAFLSH